MIGHWNLKPFAAVFAARLVGHAWGVVADVRYSEFERSAVDALSATAERYGGNWRATDVKDWTNSGRYWFSNAWGLTYATASHEQGTLYRRQGLRLGVRHSI